MSGNQYQRKCSLIVYSGAGNSAPSAPAGKTAQGTLAIEVSLAPPLQGLELGNLRIQFRVSAMDAATPPTAIIRVLNLAPSTVNQVRQEFQNVALQAGYESGNYGIIFQGSIIRIRTGRLLNNVDTFMDLLCSNWDAFYNYGLMVGSLKKGASQQQSQDAIKNAVNNSPASKVTPNALAGGMKYGYSSITAEAGTVTGGTLPRGKVLWGMVPKALDALAATNKCSWFVNPDGSISILSYTGYKPGEAVVINSNTGMIGVPEATQQGVEVNCLLNPQITLGTRIQLNNAGITTTSLNSPLGFPSVTDSPAFFASLATDGIYRVFVVEHEGDTRGEGADWLTKIVALAVDASGAAGAGSVQYNGWGGSSQTP